jgi:hypothetical protein
VCSSTMRLYSSYGLLGDSAKQYLCKNTDIVIYKKFMLKILLRQYFKDYAVSMGKVTPSYP